MVSFLLTSLQDIGAKLASNITAWIVIAHNEHFSLFGFAHANAQILAGFPNELAKMSRFENSLRFNVEVVLLDFVVPRTNHLTRIGFGITIRRPETINIFAIVWIWTMSKTIFSRQDISPFLWHRTQFLA